MTKSRIAMAVGAMLLIVGVFWLWRENPFGVARSMPSFSGYVEADYVMIASAIGGTLTTLDVSRGDPVAAGARVFLLDDVSERGARDQEQAKLNQVSAQLADLLTGRRAPEIDVIVAQRTQASAALLQSESEYERQQKLRVSGVSSVQQLEAARSQRDRDQGHLNELDAQLNVARLPGRDAQLGAAQAAVTAEKAALVQAEWRLTQKTGVAPTAGIVADTLYRLGETVGAGLPVVKLLPPENLKIRFFVSEDMVARLSVGENLRVSCDGCATPVDATVSFISPTAEYTPPVIYSRDQRSRMVFMIEARPRDHVALFRVGQPVDVSIARP